MWWAGKLEEIGFETPFSCIDLRTFQLQIQAVGRKGERFSVPNFCAIRFLSIRKKRDRYFSQILNSEK
ncbi:hypothetical protein V6N13_015141 [Hibiscus sabdariffa]|uniref:Uncharacterized protein n=2 Tax=Hibiscus sabdariffa TaxID=183260 RepID=A0ABR2A827_9ROSI